MCLVRIASLSERLLAKQVWYSETDLSASLYRPNQLDCIQAHPYSVGNCPLVSSESIKSINSQRKDYLPLSRPPSSFRIPHFHLPP